MQASILEAEPPNKDLSFTTSVKQAEDLVVITIKVHVLVSNNEKKQRPSRMSCRVSRPCRWTSTNPKILRGRPSCFNNGAVTQRVHVPEGDFHSLSPGPSRENTVDDINPALP